MITACHSCELNGKQDPRCLNCRRVNQDDIRIAKTPHTRSEMVAAQPQAEPYGYCTKLPHEVEDTLRQAMASFWGLDPIELLCVQHIMRGQRLSAFGNTLRKIYQRIGKYRGSERAQAGMMRDAIARKMPMLAPILKAHAKGDDEEDQGCEAEVSTEEIAEQLDLPGGDLFEAAGIPLKYDELSRKTKR